MSYKPTTSQPSFPLIEEAVQKFWEENKTFEKSVKNREGAKSFVFWDGPPGANGEPHYGHISVSSMKDAVCRYQTMRGHQVKRNFGWDCHGLPVEIEVCKRYKLQDRQAILDYGIDKFNSVCEAGVQKYKSVWVKQLKRIGRWGDYDNQYHTMDQSYMESVIAVVKKLDEKGLLYEAYKTMPYSWGAETPLSNAEAKMEYQERVDKAVTVLVELEKKPNTHLVLWTTTPWTLPSNMLVAVGKNIDYIEVEEDGKKYILAENLVEKYFKNPLITNRYKGSDLKGMTYKPIFPYFSDMKKQGCFKVCCADFVTTTEGTGLVHIAPFGEDDYNLLVEKKISVVCPVNEKAEFLAPVNDYLGLNVFDSNEKIIRDLKSKGALVKQESYVHNYPYCWRTKTPLIYKPVESWFVNVQKVKKQVIANNQKVNWITEHLKNGRMGKWLENAKDWSITRNRFWGTPMPVWESDNSDFPRTDIFGSIAEIEKVSGMKIKDLHRPEIDNVIYKNPDDKSGKTMMRRVSFVLDCWFDAGCMPYGSIHYPFENKDKFEQHFPADFIIEGQDQTRGWFYGLMVLSTALFEIPAYKNVMCNGMVLAGDGKKMSKSLGNYNPLDELFEKIGGDPFRWFILSSPLFNAESVATSFEKIQKASRNALLPLWNAYHFFTLYANADEIKAEEISKSSDILDTYILAKKQDLEIKITDLLDNYKFDKATEEISKFLEILNNWYIRRSRTRFWGTDVSKESEQTAFNTLYTVLISVVKLIAPITPMFSEFIFQNLTGEESVHLTDWKKTTDLSNEQHKLIESMDAVRAFCSAGKTIRENTKLRNRLPLKSATIVRGDFKVLEQFSSLVADELNLKSVLFSSDLNSFAKPFLYIKTPEVGKRLGSALQKIIPASKKNQYEIKDNKLHIAGYILNENEFESRLEIKKGFTGKALSDNTGVIILDTEITDELFAEGLARDFVRLIQDERKRLDFNISDRIIISYESENKKVLSALKKFGNYIKEQVLADKIQVSDSKHEGILDTIKIKFEVKK